MFLYIPVANFSLRLTASISVVEKVGLVLDHFWASDVFPFAFVLEAGKIVG